MLGPAPGLKLSTHVDVFKNTGGQRVLVSTTRPCAICGQALDRGLVVPVNETEQAHAACR